MSYCQWNADRNLLSRELFAHRAQCTPAIQSSYKQHMLDDASVGQCDGQTGDACLGQRPARVNARLTAVRCEIVAITAYRHMQSMCYTSSVVAPALLGLLSNTHDT